MDHNATPPRRRNGGRGTAAARWAAPLAAVAIAAAGCGSEPSSGSPAAAADRTEQPAPATTTPAPEPTPTTSSPAPEPKPKKKASKAPKKKAATTTPRRTRGTSGSPGRTASAPSSAAGQVVALTNAERRKKGCSALTIDGRLQNAAQRHSADMVARGYFSHSSPSGKGPGDRITAAGYRWSTYGENIAAGQPTPASVVSSWMNSSGHRANILNCSFKNIGIGLARKGGTPYWTQVFAAR
ncbi:CAP domain-containing protein [Spirillospora sp. NPDC029432]|uniref:CAP domain-containing protein n=1 Tax=Spirillospora sp. NPDC029432 TaxID=3154599 RepID=UPI00345537A5